MADQSEQYLDEPSPNQFAIVTVDADGHKTTKSLTPSQALKYVNDSIKQWGLAVPKNGQTEEVIDKAALQDTMVRLAILVQNKQTGRTPALYKAIRAALQDNDAIKLFTSDPRISEADALRIWPDLHQRIPPSPAQGGDNGIEGGQGGEAGNDRAIGGVTKETTLPAAEKAGNGTGTSSPPLVSAVVTDPARAADPVLPFSGQFLVEATDIEIEGIGLDLCFERTYLHNTLYEGPLGRRWDHSYNLWLREAVETGPDERYEHVVYRSNGKLAAQRFIAASYDDDPGDPGEISDATFVPNSGSPDRLVKTAGRFLLIAPDGLRIEYNDDLRAETIRDRNDNTIRFVYDGEPSRVIRIVDTCGRHVDFAYDDFGRLVRAHDVATNREIFYGYDDAGRLETVHRTTEDGAEPTLTSAYRYWAEGAPSGLEDNIVAVIDGRRREVLQVDYGTEPGLISFNRVVEQRDGGVTGIDYSFIYEPDPDRADDELAIALLRADIKTPTGHFQQLDYNQMGFLLRSSLDDEGINGPVTIESSWRYNADGLMVLERRPDGSFTEYEYGREVFARTADPESASPAERATFGLLGRVVEHKRPGSAGPPLRITEMDYDPRFALAVEQRGPYYATELQNRVDTGPAFTVQIDYDAHGNAIAVRHPDCLRPDGTTQTGLGVTLEVDGRGRLSRRSIELEDGTSLATVYEYPPDGDPRAAAPFRVTTDADGIGLVRLMDTDPAGRATRIQQPAGLVTKLWYDHLGRTVRVEESDPASADPDVTVIEWAPHDRPARRWRNRVGADGVEEPAAGMVEQFEFDAEGNVASSRLRSDDGTIDRVVTLARGPDHVIRKIVEDGVETTIIYNARSLPVTREVQAPGQPVQRWRMGYDVAGRLVNTTAPTGQHEEVEYDGFGRIRKRTTASGSQEFSEWDAGDRLLRRRLVGRHPDVSGATRLSETRITYDACGRMMAEEEAIFDPQAPPAVDVWARRSHTYDRAGRVVNIDGPDGLSQTFTYDGLGRVVHAEDGTGTIATTVFDDVLRQVRHDVALAGTDSVGNVVTATLTSQQRLDARGRIVEHDDGLGNTTRREMDSHGNLTAVIDAAGARHEAIYAPDERVETTTIAAATADELSWTYQRDPFRRIVGLAGPRGTVMGIHRDALGRPDHIEPASGSGKLDLSYDAAGRLAQSTEASGLVTRIDYGPHGNVSRHTVDATHVSATSTRRALGSTAVDFDYDGAGRLVLADDGAIPVARRFDSRGLLLSERTDTTLIEWDYDGAGRAVGFAFPSGRHITFERAAGGGLQRIVNTAAPGTEILRTWPWGLASLREQRWRGTTLRTESRDGAGRLLTLEERRTLDGTLLLDLRQVADMRGLPAARQITVGPATELHVYDTDAQGRLVAQTFGVGMLDTAGLDATLAPVSQGAHDAAVAAARATLPAPAVEKVDLTLEADGTRRTRIVRRAGAPPQTTLYDSLPTGRVTPSGVNRVDDGDALPEELDGRTFAYDHTRQLVAVAQGPASLVEITRDALGRPRRLRTAGVDVQITHDGAWPVDIRGSTPTTEIVRLPGSGIPVEVDDGTPRRVLFDADGTALGMVDQNGAVVAHVVRDAFGLVRDQAGAWPPFVETFHRMPTLDGTGLLLAPMRTYQPEVGTFLEPDPALLADGINRYLFARGNPTAFTDLTGLMSSRSAAAGRPKGEGFVFGAGTRLATEWWDQALYHWANAVAGGLSTLVKGLLIEPAKQVWDMGGGVVEVTSKTLELGHYEHKFVSGIGQMGNIGVGGVFTGMGKSIIGTPGRMWDAAEKGDYYQFGAEGLNTYMMGRSVAEMTNVGNWGVRGLGLLGKRGAQWRFQIREWQVARMEAAANKVLQRAGADPVEFAYAGEGNAYGGYIPGNAIPRIYESAFTPNPLDVLLGPKVGGAAGQSTLGVLRYSLSNALRGNTTLRTMVHEGWHAHQFATLGELKFMELDAIADYEANELEWTQPGSTVTGAWNFEMNTPVGTVPQSPALFVVPANATTEAPPQ